MKDIKIYQDLSDYSHLIEPYKFDGVKNVGWLDLESDYNKGRTSSDFLEKLKLIAVNANDFRPIMEPIREFPSCEICGELRMRDSKGDFILNSELWIPSGNIIYASPISILHYIEVHNYLPPAEYVDAVNNLDVKISFDAEAVNREKLVTSGWFARPR